MKRIAFIFTMLCLVAGMVQAQDEKGPVISAEETTFDFGTIKEKEGNVVHVFKIKNTGDKPLMITRVIASCGCTSPQWPQEPIAPNGTGEIKVTFNPVGRPGPFAKPVNVYSNGKAGSFSLTIRGTVE